MHQGCPSISQNIGFDFESFIMACNIIICFSLFVIAEIAAQKAPVPGEVYLFKEANYKGDAIQIKLMQGYCKNFEKDGDWNDKVASIDMEKNTCVVAYENNYCGGEAIRLGKSDRGNKNLQDIRWKHRISSMALC